MITGDGEATALAIAAHLGLVDESPSAAPASDAGPDAAGDGRLSILVTDRGDGESGGGGPSDAAAELGAEHEVDTELLSSRGLALSGAAVDSMTEEALAQRVQGTVTVFFRTTPRHKMKIVHAFQRGGYVVAMTGERTRGPPAPPCPRSRAPHSSPRLAAA